MEKIKKNLICCIIVEVGLPTIGLVEAGADTEFYVAPVGRIARFLVQDTSIGTIFLVLSLEACYGYVLSCLDIKDIISSVLN